MVVEILALPAPDFESRGLECTTPGYQSWLPSAVAQAEFPSDVFKRVCDGFVRHPERNRRALHMFQRVSKTKGPDDLSTDLQIPHAMARSSSILRCDILSEQVAAGLPSFHLQLPSYRTIGYVRRMILPRRPFDASLEQDCLFLEHDDGHEHALVLIPALKDRSEASVPYYHPKVAGIAIRYRAPSECSNDTRPTAFIQLDFLPLGESVAHSRNEPYFPQDSRTYRTALHLLTTIVKHGNGMVAPVPYQKRVHHDTIVPRENFQDLYLVLKEKFSWILREWPEKTDPVKHVFEDVAIATFLICLWQGMYPDSNGRPPGGFVDVGCGNGLLVYILTQEGYSGYGFDLRARKSWPLWGDSTPLKEATMLPAELCLQDASPFPDGSFLIGNHADELTPWLPLLAARTPRSGFVNIPCCFHTLSGRFTKSTYSFPEDLIESSPTIRQDWQSYESLASEKGGRYNAYMSYIAEITVRSGWRLEREALRIPSTKCWAFVGRRRLTTEEGGQQHGSGGDDGDYTENWIQVTAAQAKTTFSARKPEGKEH